MQVSQKSYTRLPSWLRRSLPQASSQRTNGILAKYQLTTVCEEAKCPNRTECYSRNTATFMIMGDTCTRSCGFCDVATGQPKPLEVDEPARVAAATKELGLKYIVITSVARDELGDEGASHFAETVRTVKETIPGIQVEVLTPDFHNRRELIRQVINEQPIVYNHNLETVARLQKEVRVQGTYAMSLGVLESVKAINCEMTTKSGLMLGLGEKREEIIQTAKDLLAVGCDVLTLGQYLAPGKKYLPIQEFITPEFFSEIAAEIKTLGFRDVFAGPYIRSSYHAGETYLNLQAQGV